MLFTCTMIPDALHAHARSHHLIRAAATLPYQLY